MFLPDSSYAIHKAWLYRILTGIIDDPLLVQTLRFKGGTCAAMRGFLDRFSVNLDFDLLASEQNLSPAKKQLEKLFQKLGLTIKDKSSVVPQYFLKYPPESGKRNTIKVEALFPPPESNEYEAVRLTDIDRIIYCHTLETMVANKMVAILDRHEKHGSIAGRDIYDIHAFLLKGFRYKKEIIIERRDQSLNIFFQELIKFIDQKVTETIINQDLNYLLPPKLFQQIRKILKQELLMLLKDELRRLENNG